jgi:hypothetical protein
VLEEPLDALKPSCYDKDSDMLIILMSSYMLQGVSGIVGCDWF